MMHDWASPPKKPARVAGMVFRLTLLYLILLAFGYHWGREPVVPLKVAAIIAAAVTSSKRYPDDLLADQVKKRAGSQKALII